jgi:hypothetical protein
MALSLGGMTEYVKSTSAELLVQAVLKGETIDLIKTQPGIKYKDRLFYFTTDAVFQAASCAFSTNGTTTLTEKDVSVVSVKVNESICPEDLNKYQQSLEMSPGWNKTIPFEQVYFNTKMLEISKTIETNIWANQVATTTYPSGLIYQFLNDTTITGNTMVSQNLTGYTTASEWLAAVYALQNKLPEAIQSFTDLTLFVGHPIFRKMIQTLVVANLYHIDMTTNNGMNPFMFPGTNIKVVPVNGLNSLNNMVLTPASNLAYLTDLVSEEDKIEWFWDQSDQICKFIARFKYGVSYYFSEYVVLSKL